MKCIRKNQVVQMKKIQRLTVLAVFILTLLTSISTVCGEEISKKASQRFSDVQEKVWYEATLEAMLEKGIIEGYDDNTFRGTREMTVEQFLKTMVVAVSGKQEMKEGDSHWFDPYKREAEKIGITKGIEEIDYSVAITRAQMAKIANTTIGILEGEKNYKHQEFIPNTVTDRYEIYLTGYRDDVYKMYEVGILTGYNNGSYKPDNGLKRQEAIAVVHRVIDPKVRKPFKIASYDYTDFPDKVKKAIETAGLSPMVMENNVIFSKETAVDGATIGFGYGEFKDGYSIIIERAPYTRNSTSWYLSFQIDQANLFMDHPEYKEEYLTYYEYMIGKHMRDYTELSEEAIKTMTDMIRVRYNEYELHYTKDIRRYSEDKHVNVYDPYGREMCFIDTGSNGRYIMISGLLNGEE